MIRIGTVLLSAAALSVTLAAPLRAQPADLETILKSYGFELKKEGERRVVEVTLHQVLQLALERNLTLQSVRMGENIASSVLDAARERFNPTLTSKADYAKTVTPSSAVIPPAFASLSASNVFTLSSELSKPTESGIEYGLKYTEKQSQVGSSSIATDGADAGPFTTGTQIGVSALTGSLTVPIGQDFGSEFNTIPFRRAEAGFTGSRLTTRQTELSLLQSTASTYWDLVAALENVRVQEDAVKLSEQLLADNQQRLQAGVLSPFDVQVTETQLARERQTLLTARSDVLRIEDLARALLNLQVIDFQILPLDRPQVHEERLDYDPLLQKVFDSNPDIKQLENQLLTNGLDLQEAQNKDRTNLDLELFYTLQGVKGSPFGGVSGFTKTNLDSYGATLTWTLPLFDVQTRESIRQRTLERERLRLQLESRKSDLTVSLQSALRQLSVARDQVETAGVAKRLAEEQLKNEIERFRVGESTSFQVAQSQQDAASAQVQEILARLGFERNFLQLLALTGEIYGRYGLQAP